ncbi:uncharacterized protein M6B38_144225 [Iris pallida]|uniref:Uncharacterized protein n=1 Tax=Iris pallida TaxID=29817 RepID=A0AAX6FB94_IRIPA|nr:uncharacterized protein M6B38_144225 [Iris pallida]
MVLRGDGNRSHITSSTRGKQELMSVQLESYRAALGGFSEEMALDHISQVPPGYSNRKMASLSNSLVQWTQGLVFCIMCSF